MRDRVAVVFMTLSLVATLVLGGAVVHELGRPASSQIIAAGGAATTGSGATAGTPGIPGAADTGAPTSGSTGGASAGSAGSAGTPGHLVTAGSTSSGAGGPA